MPTGWTLAGLSVDSGSDYQIGFAVDGWPDQSYPGVYLDDAEVISFVTSETDHIALGDHRLLNGVSVSGTAVGPGGPINGGVVEVYSPSQVVDVPIVGGVWSASGLPPGELLVWAEVDGLATTYFPNADRPQTRLAALDEGDVVANVDLILPAESRIVGRIVSDEDMSAISLLAYNDDRTVALSGDVDSDGFFEVHQLHGGDYTLQVFAESVGLISDEIRDDDGVAMVFSVPPQGVLDLGDIAIPPGAVIEGTAVDAYSGDRIYGAFIYAESEEHGTITLAVSDDKGRYDISGLRQGTYRMWADYQYYCDTDADWVARYWPNVANPVLNGSIQVRTGETVRWDPTMPPDRDHDQMDDHWEKQWGLDRQRDDGGEDPDGDGFTNLEEYQLGTDPLDGRNSGGCGCGGGRSGLLLLLMLPIFRRRR